MMRIATFVVLALFEILSTCLMRCVCITGNVCDRQSSADKNSFDQRILFENASENVGLRSFGLAGTRS